MVGGRGIFAWGKSQVFVAFWKVKRVEVLLVNQKATYLRGQRNPGPNVSMKSCFSLVKMSFPNGILNPAEISGEPGGNLQLLWDTPDLSIKTF